MDENLKPSEEELALEDEALVDTKEEEIRASIIEKYGLDEDEQPDLIESLTKDILAQKKSFGKVVNQKRSWRDKALGPSEKKPEKKNDKNLSADEIRKQAKEDLLEEFAKRDLEELDLSDELKEEVKKLAKLNGVSIRKATTDPYIIFLKSQEEANKKLENSTITHKNKGKAVVIDTSKPLNPADFNLATPEGRKQWDDAKKARKS